MRLRDGDASGDSPASSGSWYAKLKDVRENIMGSSRVVCLRTCVIYPVQTSRSRNSNSLERVPLSDASKVARK